MNVCSLPASLDVKLTRRHRRNSDRGVVKPNSLAHSLAHVCGNPMGIREMRRQDGYPDSLGPDGVVLFVSTRFEPGPVRQQTDHAT